MKKLLVLAAIALAAGCAQTPANRAADEQPRAQREYPTGSNIPRKNRDGDGVQVYGREAVEQAQQASPGVPRER